MDTQDKEKLNNAIQHQDNELAKEIIDKYDATELSESNENSLSDNFLMRAIDRGSDEIALMLIDKGVDVHAVNIKGETAIERLTPSTNHLGELLAQKLYDAGAEKTNYFYPKMTPLMQAIKFGNSEEAKHLIAEGAGVNDMDTRGNPVWKYALDAKNVEIFKELINSGIDLNVPLKDGQAEGLTALTYALNPILMRGKNEEFANLCLDAKVDVNIGKKSGNCALGLARNYPNLVRRLIEEGAEVDNSPGRRLFIIAPVETMSLLIDAGWNINKPTIIGNKEMLPIHAASYEQNIETVAFLQSKGANINACDNEGHPPLFYSVQSIKDLKQKYSFPNPPAPSPEFVQQLIEHGAKVTPEILKVAKDKEIQAILKNALKKDKEALKQQMKNQKKVSTFEQERKETNLREENKSMQQSNEPVKQKEFVNSTIPLKRDVFEHD